MTSVGGGGGSLGGTLGGGGGSLGGLSRVRVINPFHSLHGYSSCYARSVVPGEALMMTSAPLERIRRYQYIAREQRCLCLLLRFHIKGIGSPCSDWRLQRSCTSSQHDHAGKEGCSRHASPFGVVRSQAGGSSFATTLGGSEGGRIGAIPEGEVGDVLSLVNLQQQHTLHATVLQDLYPACAPRRQPLQASWRLSELAALIRSYQGVHGLLVMDVSRLPALSCKAHHTLSILPLSFRKDDREPSAMMSCSATMSSVSVFGRVA